MNRLFWVLVALDAVLFLILLAATLVQPRSPDGGREMSLIFSVLLPGGVIGVAVLIYLYAGSPGWRWLSLFIVAGPGLLLGGVRVRSAWIDHLVRQNALGRGYFGGSALKRMGAAVVRRDTAALLALAPEVDVNHEGKGGMTLLRLAVDQAFESGGADSSIPSALPVVRTLIGLGARPEQGLEVATKLADPEYLRVLLEAGANPGHRTSEGPVIFAWLGVMPVTNLRVLADHGLDLNLTDRYGAPLLVAAAEQDRWDLIELLLDRGADPGRRDRHGRAVGDVVLDRITSATSYGRPAPPGLERIRARLAGNGVTR